MGRAMALCALGAIAVVALAGCSPSAAVAPPGPSRDEIKATLSYLVTGDTDGYSVYGVDLIRPVAARDVQRVYRACLADLGVADVTYSLGTFRTDYTTQAAAKVQEHAIATCRLEFPKSDDIRQLHTARQWGYQYDYLRNVFTPCIRAEGLRVPGLGSRSGFIAAGLRFGVSDAYETMNIDVTSVRGKALEGRCPSTAPGLEG